MFPTNMLYCELPGTTTRSVQFFRNATEPGNILLLVPATERYNFLAVLGLTINPTETLLLVWCYSTGNEEILLSKVYVGVCGVNGFGLWAHLFWNLVGHSWV